MAQQTGGEFLWYRIAREIVMPWAEADIEASKSDAPDRGIYQGLQLTEWP